MKSLNPGIIIKKEEEEKKEKEKKNITIPSDITIKFLKTNNKETKS